MYRSVEKLLALVEPEKLRWRIERTYEREFVKEMGDTIRRERQRQIHVFNSMDADMDAMVAQIDAMAAEIAKLKAQLAALLERQGADLGLH